MIPLYTWSGRYCGFILNDYIFDRRSKYLGWLEDDGRAWRANGHFWGELTDENYILHKTAMGVLGIRGVRGTPGTPGIPGTHGNRSARAPKAGYTDALADLV